MLGKEDWVVWGITDTGVYLCLEIAAFWKAVEPL